MTDPVVVTTDWALGGTDAVIIENALVRVVLLPGLGGKVWQLTHKPGSRDLLWHHPRLRPRPVPFGSAYDDVFYGGWDELFPNDVPEVVNGEPLPDHGEVWSLPWNWTLEVIEPDRVTVHLWVETSISACRLDKWVTVLAGEPAVRFRHRVTNLGHDDLPYLWKLHMAVALAEDSRIELGARDVRIGDWGAPRTGATGGSYRWPFVIDDTGEVHDMRRTLPASSRVCELQYATRLERGWCAITHPRERIGLGLRFDTAIFPCCWTFASYGGWRNLRVAVLEPCTGYPLSVGDGVAQGTHRVLGAGETLGGEVTAEVFELDPGGQDGN